MAHSLEAPAWKSVAGHVLAFGMAVIFLVAGIYKILNPFPVSRMMEQALVWYQISMPFTILLGIGETLGGVLILVPRFRRWGAVLVSLLLIAFMVYIGINYNKLVGADCSCFPWIKRTVSPMFFVVDGLWLVAAVLAGMWAKEASSTRGAAVTLGVIAVFAAVSYGSASIRQTGTKAPESVVVDGKDFSLSHGRIFVFFYDPECSHCDQAARTMSKFKWKSDIQIVAVPTSQPQFAAAFLHDTELKAVTSLELAKLKAVFPFGDPPYGVTLEGGRMTGAVAHYEDAEPLATLRKAGFVE